MNKYRAEPILGFDSKAERLRFEQLRLLERAGQISDLACQFPLPVTPDGCPPRHLIVDFVYRTKAPNVIAGVPEGALVAEDVKSKATETQVWALKWHLARFHHQDYTWVTSYLVKRGYFRTRIWPSPPTR
jgi:hypothetical protein